MCLSPFRIVHWPITGCSRSVTYYQCTAATADTELSVADVAAAPLPWSHLPLCQTLPAAGL
jgi:hypothetical protein